MSVLPQFLGMRERHDEHRDVESTGPYRSWQDCDTCLAVVAFDELARAAAAVLEMEVGDYLWHRGLDVYARPKDRPDTRRCSGCDVDHLLKLLPPRPAT